MVVLTSNPENMEPRTLMEMLWLFKGENSLVLSGSKEKMLEKIMEKAQELTDSLDEMSR